MSGLEIVKWAEPLGNFARGGQLLGVDSGPRATRMAHSVATGRGLVTNGALGVDEIRVPAGGGFVPHTHPGDHILIVVVGTGTITFDGAVTATHAGEVYMVPGHVAHAVGAITDHVILAVGSPHRAVDDLERMAPTEYAAVLADVGDMRCSICERAAIFPAMLHDLGCSHCPGPCCVTTGEEALDEELRRDLTLRRDAARRHAEEALAFENEARAAGFIE